ncbi:SDA1-like protein [Nymphaea thermarum]|nr:SDA1-like protein [Nymphaea thermarum]
MVRAEAAAFAGGMMPESLTASGRSAEKLSLVTLQSEMKRDPEGYEEELGRVYSRFHSSLDLFRQTAGLSRLSGGCEPAVAKELGDLCMFLAHVMPFYPGRLDGFPGELVELLRINAASLPGDLRLQIAKALMLLGNRGMVDIAETVSVFMDLQTLQHGILRKLAFSHVVHSIRRMNQKNKKKDGKLNPQDILINMLKEDDEARARRSLRVLCDLHRRKVWFDDKTANAICEACFHRSSRVMKDALSFLLGYERVGDNESENSDSEDEGTEPKPVVIINKEDVYKAHHKGTTASKKKKKAKLERVMRSLKRQQRVSSENMGPNSYSPLSRLRDAQGFAEKLFSHLQTCNELFEACIFNFLFFNTHFGHAPPDVAVGRWASSVYYGTMPVGVELKSLTFRNIKPTVRMMMLKVIARTIGLHCLILLNFYPYIQKYAQPHQKDVTSLLAAAVQACHHMVPPDAVESLFRQIVNQFIHDRSRPEAIAVGLNVVREICLRIPLLMTEELLQDLVLYRSSREKAVSSAARSLMSLFRQLCPALLSKKDRGRSSDPKARPKAFGEVKVSHDVPGADLLLEYQQRSKPSDGSDVDEDGFISDSGIGEESGGDDDSDSSAGCVEREEDVAMNGSEEAEEEDEEEEEEEEEEVNGSEEAEEEEEEEVNGSEEADVDEDDEEEEEEEDDKGENEDGNSDRHDYFDAATGDEVGEENGSHSEPIGDGECRLHKRKQPEPDIPVSTDSSLGALRRLVSTKMEDVTPVNSDGILSNEEFQLIKKLKAKKEAKLALASHGLSRGQSDSNVVTKIPDAETLHKTRVDPTKLEANIKRKLSKEERLAIVKAGREERGKYLARTAVKQKKTGGLSNRQKEHKKAMPLAARRAKAARSKQEKKNRQKHSGKQFRGRKAWK